MGKRMPRLENNMREFIVENLTNTEALSVTVILMNNVIALPFLLCLLIKFLMQDLHTAENLIFRSDRSRSSQL